MDSSLGILKKGYTYFQEKFDEGNTDIYSTRLLFKKAIVLRGEEAAQLFYDRQKFKRKGATPKRFQKTLFGVGGVQGLDGQAHLHRKNLFMECMKPESLAEINRLFEKHWLLALAQWQKSEETELFWETEKILAQASCEWTGIPLPPKDIALRSSQLDAMIDASGAVGARHQKGRKARKQAERWLSELIGKLRNKEMEVAPDSIFHNFATYRGPEGQLPDKHIIAVELLNLLRPIVAIARYIVFTAKALHDHPEYYNKLKNGPDELYLFFVQEVRRYCPFFPFVAAKVELPFDWKGFHFKKGCRVLLDLYATNHDQRIWKDAGSFRPERFNDWNGSAYNFIPQGGGGHHENHRCAGEWITIQLTQKALNLLINRMQYTVPPQDLSIRLNRIPAIPESKFKIRVQE